AYAAVKQLTNEKTATMGYAMIYGLMNLGGFASGLVSPLVRHHSERTFPPNGITGVLWVYVGFTLLALLATAAFLPRPRRPLAQRQAPGTAAKGTAGAPPPLLSARWVTEHPL